MSRKTQKGNKAPYNNKDDENKPSNTALPGEIQGTLGLHALFMQLEGARHAADMPPPYDDIPASADDGSLISKDDPPANPAIGKKIDAPVSGKSTDAPVFRDAPDAPAIGTQDANHGSEREEHVAPTHSTWETRLSHCQDLMPDMARTLVGCAVSACINGPSALAGYVYPTHDTVRLAESGENKGGVVTRTTQDLNTDVGDNASGDSTSDHVTVEDELGTLKIPRAFRITSRRVYGRILSFHGFSGPRPFARSYAIVGSAVNIPQQTPTSHPGGSNRNLTVLVIAPMVNLCRDPYKDRGNTKPLCDMAVGMPVVGTLESLSDGSELTRFGYIEWALASSQEWSLEAPRSFFSLEHMISTDLHKWSMKSFEAQIMLPLRAHDSLLVVHASERE